MPESATDSSSEGISEPYLHKANGHQTNGHRENGHQGNGHQPNGHRENGHQGNGHQPNGHQANGEGIIAMSRDTDARGTKPQDVGNPLIRFLRWIASFAIPGIGMFMEAYFIFSVGNIKPIWVEQYPRCWKENIGCSPEFLHTLSYSQVAGLFLGMVAVGFTVDRIGRKNGSIVTAFIMLAGGVLLTAARGSTAHTLFLFLIIAQTIFGFGVGGEFPVAASSASERAESSEKLKALRGQTVVLVFSMQAWGNISNLCILLFFLAVLGQTQPPYDAAKLSLTWRIQYGFGTLIIAGMLYQRLFYLKESAVWEEDRRQKREAKESGVADRSRGDKLKLTSKFYWHRLLGTSLGWFAWDFYYYGNKLFQSEFIEIIQPGTSLIGLLQFNLLNSSVALVGYYVAAFTVDKAWMGRRRMQIMGFGFVFAIFLICGLAFDQLTANSNRLKWFQALYYISSFWGQFGPNATTFLLASELFPTDTRGKAHGISAAVGKLGALAADIILGKIGDRPKFYWCAAAGLMGVIVTILFIPEITNLDLREGDLRWDLIKKGNASAYTGEAVNPKNLSVWEALTKVGRPYVPPNASTDNVEIVTPAKVTVSEAVKRNHAHVP